MKIFIYYSKFDSKKEPQGRIQAKDLKDALYLISKKKQLDSKEFLRIFEIKEI